MVIVLFFIARSFPVIAEPVLLRNLRFSILAGWRSVGMKPVDKRNSAIQPFLQPREHRFPIVGRDCPAFFHGIMMTERAIRIRVSVYRHRLIVSRSDMNMEMRIGFGFFIKAVHQAAPVAKGCSQNSFQTGLQPTDQYAKLLPFRICQLRQRTAMTLQNQNTASDIILFIRQKHRPECTLVHLKPFVFLRQIAPTAMLHCSYLQAPGYFSFAPSRNALPTFSPSAT